MLEIISKLFSQKVVQYAFIGGTIALFDLVFFYFFAAYLAFNYLWVNALGFIVATLINYYLCIRYVFESGIRYSRNTEIVVMFVIAGITLFLNQMVIYTLIELILLPLMVAKILTVSSIFIWNYLARKHIVFSGTK